MHTPADTHPAPILGSYFEPWGSTYYRLTVPIKAVGGAVAGFYAMGEAQVGAAQTVVLSKMTGVPGRDPRDLVAVIRALQGGGRRQVLIDHDDDHRGLPAKPRALLDIPCYEACARAADGLVCTNPTLAGRLRGLNRDVRVLPNLVSLADWPEPAPLPDGPPVVTLAGSPSHADDWRLVERALREVRQTHAFTLRLVGFCPDYLRPLADEVIPWAPIERYPATLAGTAIGLCPLPDTGFNRCKSPIKAYEYALSGAAVIGSPCQYGPVLDGGRGLVCRTPGEWAAALAHYLTDPDARATAARALRAHVAALDVSLHLPLVRAAYAA